MTKFQKPRRSRKKAFFIALAAFLTALVAARVALPYIAKDYVNKRLNAIEGYAGSVADLDINLWRGAYSIHEVAIEKVQDEVKRPFAGARTIDFSVQWKALLHGEIVAEAYIIEGDFNLAQAEATDDDSRQDFDEIKILDQYLEALKDLAPFTLNRLEIQNSRLDYLITAKNPSFTIGLTNLQLVVTNLTNVREEEWGLESGLEAKAGLKQGGEVSVTAKLDPRSSSPNFDGSLHLNRLPLNTLGVLFLERPGIIELTHGVFSGRFRLSLQEGLCDLFVSSDIEELEVRAVDPAFPLDLLSVHRVEANFDASDFRLGQLQMDGREPLPRPLIAELVLDAPHLEISFKNRAREEPPSEEDAPQSTNLFTRLPRFNFQKFIINQGRVRLKDAAAEVPYAVSVDNLRLEVSDFRNFEENNSGKDLPGWSKLSATTTGDGKLNVETRFSAVGKLPILDINAQWEEVDITRFNPFLREYVNVDVNHGVMNFYTEILTDGQRFTGYAKPLLLDLDFIDQSDREKSIVKKGWEAFVAAVTHLFKNQPKDQMATKIPVSGDIENADVAIWTTIGNVLYNAFIQAMSSKLDNSLPVNSNEKPG